MEILGSIVGVIGIIGFVICNIWLLVCSFQRSIVWGLLYIFLPFASIVYIFVDWNRASKPFLGSLASLLIGAGGMALSPGLQKGMSDSQSTSHPASHSASRVRHH